VQHTADQLGFSLAEITRHIKGNAAFQTLNLSQATVVCDIAGLARPGRDGAKTRQHQEQPPGGLLNRNAGAVLEQTGKDLLVVAGQLAFDFGEVGEFSIQASNSGDLLAQLLE